MAEFNKAFELILKNEGGYVNDPDDTGGETYKGIARKMWPDWSGWVIIDQLRKEGSFLKVPVTPDEIEIDNQLQYEVKLFYYQNFWAKVKGNAIINQSVANCIVDFAVNAGIESSIELAQKTVGADVDGILGSNTLSAINQFNPDHFIAAFAVEKIRKYVAICKKRETSKKYFFGWVIRAVAYLVILCFVVGCNPETSNQQPKTIYKTDSVFLKEYVLKRMNEHELQLISITDTLVLYMENTYGFDERIVFIKK